MEEGEGGEGGEGRGKREEGRGKREGAREGGLVLRKESNFLLNKAGAALGLGEY